MIVTKLTDVHPYQPFWSPRGSDYLVDYALICSLSVNGRSSIKADNLPNLLALSDKRNVLIGRSLGEEVGGCTFKSRLNSRRRRR